MASKVYFLNDKAGKLADSTPFKAVKVLRDAGLADMVKPGMKVGIKCHLGEWGNSLNLRPHWIGAIVDEVKRLGGKPEVVETCVAPYGENVSRFTKEDHLKTAALHGFTEETVGCPIKIMDGECGVDDVKCQVPHGVYMKYSYMGKGFLDYDMIIVASHFKGHVMGVFGGAMKNVGIGMGSGRGKLAAHFITHPTKGIKGWQINQDAIAQMAKAPHPNLVDRMVNNCPHKAFTYENGVLSRDTSKCAPCGYCFAYLFNGAYIMNPELIASWPPALVDAASAYINKIGKDKMIFLNYAMDITPGCDCMSFHDKSLVPNLGVFASKDPVALDMACMEMAEATVATPGSVADEYGFGAPNTERFTNCSSMAKLSQWNQLNAGEFNGIGTTEYELVNSVVEDREEFIFQPYSTAHPAFEVHKDLFAKVNMDVGDFSINDFNPQMPQAQMDIKPKGKVKETSI